jgi:hypothetical protein
VSYMLVELLDKDTVVVTHCDSAWQPAAKIPSSRWKRSQHIGAQQDGAPNRPPAPSLTPPVDSIGSRAGDPRSRWAVRWPRRSTRKNR